MNELRVIRLSFSGITENWKTFHLLFTFFYSNLLKLDAFISFGRIEHFFLTHSMLKICFLIIFLSLSALKFISLEFTDQPWI